MHFWPRYFRVRKSRSVFSLQIMVTENTCQERIMHKDSVLTCFYVFGYVSAKNLTEPHCCSFFIMKPLTAPSKHFINNEVIGGI